MTQKHNIQHPEDLPADTVCTRSHTDQLFNLPIYIWILCGGLEWPSDLDNCFVIRSNRKADARHYRSVNREAFVCIAHSEVNLHRQNYCLISSGNVERGRFSSAVSVRSVPVLLSCLLSRKATHKLTGGLWLCGSWSTLGSKLSVHFLRCRSAWQLLWVQDTMQ